MVDQEGDTPMSTVRRRNSRSAPTIYDVAELAGVNPSTVSRALSKPGRLNPSTEKLVREAAERLNYRVNPMARALPTGRTQTLALIVADITNPMFFDVARGAERTAALDGYTLVIAESQESDTREAEAAERVTPSVDGLILVTTRLTDDQIQSLAASRPLVVINRKVEGVASVVPELEPGIRQALDHLAEEGHRSIAFLAGPDRSWMSTARWETLMTLAVDRGMHIVEIGPGSPTLDGGAAALARVRASGATAVIAYNDLMAIGLLRAAQAQAIDVPGELSIIGFDDIFGSDFTSPPLSTIRTPLSRVGELAVRRLLSRIDPSPERPDPGEVVLRTEFVARGSTAPAVGRH